MGWWSASILGGDTPLDFLGDMADIVGVANRDDGAEGIDELYGYAFAKEILNDAKNVAKMQKYADARGDKEYKSIAYQIMGLILMATGANISPTLKDKLVAQARNDEWFKTKDPERVAYINQFIEAVKSYNNGIPLILKSEGLFEKISESISSGKTGLVNKVY